MCFDRVYKWACGCERADTDWCKNASATFEPNPTGRCIDIIELKPCEMYHTRDRNLDEIKHVDVCCCIDCCKGAEDAARAQCEIVDDQLAAVEDQRHHRAGDGAYIDVLRSTLRNLEIERRAIFAKHAYCRHERRTNPDLSDRDDF